MARTARAVIFDMGNVLVSIDNRRALAAFQEHLSDTLEARELEALLYGASGSSWQDIDPTGLIGDFHLGRIDTPTFVARARQRLSCAASLDDALFTRLWPDRFARNEATLELVKRLEPHRRYLLSDANDLDISWHRWHNPDIFLLFDAIFFSHETGIDKYDLQAWRNVMAVSGLPPEAHLFIDDRADHVARARSLGMQGVVYTDAESLERALVAAGYL